MKVKFIRVIEDKTGEGKNGPWRDLQFLCETTDERPKKIALNSKSDVADKISRMKGGDVFNVNYDIVSNEFNNRWYTKVVVWKVSLEAGDAPTTAYTNAAANAGDNSQSPPEEFSELPF